ncbi:MAG: cell division protein FtsA [Candidatus Omnitrophota bacterium]|jgi:cell division protein FtsA
MKKKTLAGLDISEDFVTCSICSTDEKSGAVILGVGTVPSRGVDNGSITDLSEVTQSVAEAVEKAEAAAKTKVLSLVTSCDGTSLRTYNTKGSITVAEKENEIGRREVERVTEAAKTIALPFDREIVHSVTRGFILDGQDGIKDPAGMFGTRLEVDMELVTALITNLHNLRRAINAAGFEIQDIVLSGVASGNVLLEDLDKDLGAILIYISYSATHIVVYSGGEIKAIEVVPFGGGELVRAAADAFKIPRDYAEQVIRREVNLDESPSAEDDEITLRIGGSGKTISRKSLREAVKPAAEELISRAGEALKGMRSSKEAATGCVVAGVLADLGGFLEMFELSLSMPVKMGLVKGVSGEGLNMVEPGKIVSLGLVKYWAKEGARKKVYKKFFANTPFGKVADRIQEIFSEYF